MTVMMIVAGLVLGLCVFLMLRRSVKRQEKKDELKGVKLTCQYVECQKEFDAADGWVRSRILGGDIFRCPHCQRKFRRA